MKDGPRVRSRKFWYDPAELNVDKIFVTLHYRKSILSYFSSVMENDCKLVANVHLSHLNI